MNTVTPVTCSWAQTPAACAEGRCRSLWKASAAGSLLPAVRSGWGAGRYLAAPRCHGLDALLCRGPGSRRLATGWGGVCRSKPASVTSKPTAQIPLSTEGQRGETQHYSELSVSIHISQLWKEKQNKIRGCGCQRASVSKGQHQQRALDKDARPVHDKHMWKAGVCH